jgi:hypothetical protein
VQKSLVINEIHADPHPEFGDANGDGQISRDDDEFLEFVNISSKSMDLSGWIVQDGIRDRFTFPVGTVLKAGCGLVLFGGEVGIDIIEGSLVFSAGSLGLNNDGDTVILRDLNDSLILEYQYGSEGGKDQSLTRYPDLVGELPLVLHGEIQTAEGRLFSPGTKIDGSSFGECP